MTRPFTQSSWERIKEAVGKAHELSGATRQSFLEELNRTDCDIARAVEDIIAADEQVDDLETLPMWQPDRTGKPQTLENGHVLGSRYKIVELIGAGGVGEVYRAEDSHREMQVALKIVKMRGGRDERSLSALRNELNTASQVSHPNVCRLYDITIPVEGTDGPAFITMELLAGETLARRIEKAPLSITDAQVIVKGIVAGLEAAHARRIVHRDLKPGNVMLVPEGSDVRPTILDFGLAQSMGQAGLSLTEDTKDWCAGTPAFMAPETLEGKKATVASDIYSLGVILFNMISGRLPFEGDSPLAVALKRVNSPAPLVREFVSDVDRSWEYAIARCLEPNPAKRPASASAVLQLLNAKPPFAWVYRKFAPALAAAILLGSGLTMLRPASENLEAREAVDRARVAMENRTREGFMAAVAGLKNAAEKDPKWALPWAELATAYATESNWRYLSGTTALKEAEIAAHRALDLDPKLAKAHAALAWVKSLDFEKWPQAEESFRRAVELDPRDGTIRHMFAVHLRKEGRFSEAEQQIDEALTLTHREKPNIWTERAFLLWTEGKTDKFAAHMADQLVAFPNVAFTRFMNARLLKIQGRYDEAEKELDFSRALGQNPNTVLVEKASLHAAEGRPQLALQELSQLSILQAENEQIDGLLVAGVYANLGKIDQAFAELNKAYEKRDNTLLSAATSPALRPLHSDPRFKQLLNKLHFSNQIMQQIGLSSSSLSGSASQPRSTGTL